MGIQNLLQQACISKIILFSLSFVAFHSLKLFLFSSSLLNLTLCLRLFSLLLSHSSFSVSNCILFFLLFFSLIRRLLDFLVVDQRGCRSGLVIWVVWARCGRACCLLVMGLLWVCSLFAHPGFALCWFAVALLTMGHGCLLQVWVWLVVGLGLAHSGGACGLLFVYLFIIIIFFLVLNVEC